MHITWHGLSCLKIQSKQGNLLIDPFDEKKVGLNYPHGAVDIVIDGNGVYQKNKGTFVINSPGEYEKNDLFIYYVNLMRDPEKKDDKVNKIARIIVEDVSIAFLGAISKVPGKEKMALVENVDVLVVPVGGDEVIDHKKAVELVNDIEPKIVIPVYYAIPELKKSKLEPVNKFLKELGQSGLEGEDKVKITKKDLPMEETKIYLLNNS